MVQQTSSRRVYYDMSSMTDALLKTYVTQDLVIESSDYIESLASNYGVTPSQILTPTPYVIRMIAMYYTYMKAAWLRTVYSLGKEVDKDAFRLKYDMYKSALEDLLNQLSAESFTGGVTAKKRKFPSTMGLARN